MWLPVFLLFVLLGMGRAGVTKLKWEARERACMEMAGVYSELHGRVSAVEESEGKYRLRLRKMWCGRWWGAERAGPSA